MEYFDHFFSDDKELASKLIQSYMENAEDICIPNFIVFLQNSSLLSQVFNDIFVKIYPFDNNSKYMIQKRDEFKKTINITTKKADIVLMLRNDLFFDEYYETEIGVMMGDNQLSQTKDDFLNTIKKIDLSYIKDQTLYDYLQNTICNSENEHKARMSKCEELFREKYNAKHKKTPNVLLNNKFLDFIKTKVDLSELYIDAFIEHDKNSIFEVLSNFENVFSRELSVTEFVHFQDEINQNKTFDWIKQYHIKYVEKYAMFKKLVKKYLNKDSNPSIFYLNYLHDIDTNIIRFKHSVIENLLDTSHYKFIMCKSISNIHLKLFLKEIQNFELEHIFYIFKLEQVHLFDSNISSYVSVYKNNIDKLRMSIIEVYQKMLRRTPQNQEISDFLKKHLDKNIKKRSLKDIEYDIDITSYLERKLFHSLEFDDVVKNIILSNKLFLNGNNCFEVLKKFNDNKYQLKNPIWKTDEIIHYVTEFNKSFFINI